MGINFTEPQPSAPVNSSAYAQLRVGDLMPRIFPRCAGRDKYVVDSLAGQYLVLCFYGSTANAKGRSAIEAMLAHRDRFDDKRMCFFGVCLDPQDEVQARVQNSFPGVRFMWDFDGVVSATFGATPQESSPSEWGKLRQFWMVIDPTLHVLATFPFPEDNDHSPLFAFLDRLPHPNMYAGFEMPAPILVLPHVFEPGLCRHLIGLYDAHGGGESGVMRGNAGVIDGSFKRRKDYVVDDEKLKAHIRQRIVRRVLPEIERIFFLKATRIERYIVGCYAAEDGGHFMPHRDNTSDVSAHRRFAISINLSGDFEGGAVSFPEYNSKGYKARPGWAVVFPCNILHAVSKVTSGRRYAFLPFVYDEAGASIREQNLQKQINQQVPQ
jgi:predicted 2-oxoglutarate/Fe(II)-dependent dioxygenase YbiX/peroxiredoxin